VPKELILGIDPGDVTGWSWWQVEAHRPASRLTYGLIQGGIEGFITACRDLDESIIYPGEHSFQLMLRNTTTVVFEQFKLNGDAINPQTEALEIQGAMKMKLRDMGNPPELVIQSRDKKRNVRDSILKGAGLYLNKREIERDMGIEWTDARDINDSQIHVLGYLKDRGHVPTMREYWPPND
jgi:hypothetical protein